jgi:hypothetical protein
MNTTTIITIAALLSVTGIVAGLVCKRQWELLRYVVFALVTEAERQYGSGTGRLKFAEVVKALTPYVPAIIRAFVSNTKLEALVESVLEQAKELWAGNPKLLELPKNTVVELPYTTSGYITTAAKDDIPADVGTVTYASTKY